MSIYNLFDRIIFFLFVNYIDSCDSTTTGCEMDFYY